MSDKRRLRLVMVKNKCGHMPVKRVIHQLTESPMQHLAPAFVLEKKLRLNKRIVDKQRRPHPAVGSLVDYVVELFGGL